ncbi:MAG: class I SAM-dependent methyltransferase [Candidatus Aenigmatarchaeota archaeon]
MDTNEYNKNFYSNIFAKESGKYYKIQEKKIKVVLEFFSGQKNGKILDVGCGDGFISAIISKETGAKVYGIDISADAVAEAGKKGIDAKTANIDKEFPFEKNSFDAVFCGDVIEHIYDTENLLTNINRSLKTNGCLVISVPNIASWYNRGFLFLGFMPTWIESSLKTYTGNPFIKEGVGHIHAFTKRSLKELLEMHGFSIEKIKGTPVMADGSRKKWQERLWNAVDSAFARKTTFASTIIFRARKVREMHKKEPA